MEPALWPSKCVPAESRHLAQGPLSSTLSSLNITLPSFLNAFFFFFGGAVIKGRGTIRDSKMCQALYIHYFCISSHNNFMT